MERSEILDLLTKEPLTRQEAQAIGVVLVEDFRLAQSSRDKSAMRQERRGVLQGYHTALVHLEEFGLQTPQEMRDYLGTLREWVQGGDDVSTTTTDENEEDENA